MKKGFLEKQFRTVVPRWRFFDIAALASEANGIRPSRADIATTLSEQTEYEQAVREFRANPSVWYAGDLLPMSLARDDTAAVRDVVGYILDSDAASPILRDLALSQVEEPKQPSPIMEQADVGALRHSLTVYGWDALGWLDLALHYTRIGNLRRARRSVTAALQIAPDNRYVLRSASRFFIHADDPEQAQAIVLRATNTKADPWLMAAEVAAATAANKWPKLVKEARRSVSSGNFSPRHVSELASALATVEWRADSATQRHLRTLVRRSLEDPTENSVAQAQWLSLNDESRSLVERRLVPVSVSAEALAWKAFSEGAFAKCVIHAKAWFEDQPFSSRPARVLTYVLESLLKDFKGAIDIATAALIPNREDALLWNNLAFAFLGLGEQEKAAESIRRATSLKSDDVATKLAIRATQGLLAFREGKSEIGRSIYERVILDSQRLGDDVDPRIPIMALAYLAREEARLGNIDRAQYLLAEASRSARVIQSPDAALIVEDITRVLEELPV